MLLWTQSLSRPIPFSLVVLWCLMGMDGWTMDAKFCGNSLHTIVGFGNIERSYRHPKPSQSDIFIPSVTCFHLGILDLVQHAQGVLGIIFWRGFAPQDEKVGDTFPSMSFIIYIKLFWLFSLGLFRCYQVRAAFCSPIHHYREAISMLGLNWKPFPQPIAYSTPN